jgi:hypothetical protein
MPGVHGIYCECGKMYVGQTWCLTEMRVKEHYRHIRLFHPKKYLVAEHSISLDLFIQVHNTSFLAKKLRRMNRIIREATEFELHPISINKEAAFSLSRSWKPLIHDLREKKQAVNKNVSPSSEP